MPLVGEKGATICVKGGKGKGKVSFLFKALKQ